MLAPPAKERVKMMASPLNSAVKEGCKGTSRKDSKECSTSSSWKCDAGSDPFYNFVVLQFEIPASTVEIKDNSSGMPVQKDKKDCFEVYALVLGVLHEEDFLKARAPTNYKVIVDVFGLLLFSLIRGMTYLAHGVLTISQCNCKLREHIIIFMLLLVAHVRVHSDPAGPVVITDNGR
ncbi:hypothetical protein ABFS82_05G135300 [Erythranthe guttata]